MMTDEIWTVNMTAHSDRKMKIIESVMPVAVCRTRELAIELIEKSITGIKKQLWNSGSIAVSESGIFDCKHWYVSTIYHKKLGAILFSAVALRLIETTEDLKECFT